MPPEAARDATEIEALVTDRYLETLLAAHASGADLAPAPIEVDPGIRAIAEHLARGLPRLHPSFRFEEALSARLTAAALAHRLPQAAGAEGVVVPIGGSGGSGGRSARAAASTIPRSRRIWTADRSTTIRHSSGPCSSAAR